MADTPWGILPTRAPHGGWAPQRRGTLLTEGPSHTGEVARMRSQLRRHSLVLALGMSCIGGAARAQSFPQPLPDIPFAPGERLTYTGRVHVGVAGSGTIWVEGPSELRGTPTWVLHSDMQGKLGPIKATERNASWLDPMHMAALRYTSDTHHLWKKNQDAV